MSAFFNRNVVKLALPLWQEGGAWLYDRKVLRNFPVALLDEC